MELWEYNCCIKAYNDKKKEEAKETITAAWMTANLANTAIAGKLKPLKSYVEAEQEKAPQLSYEEFDRKLKSAKKWGDIFGA